MKLIPLLIAVLLAPLPCSGQAGIITTVAGGGTATGSAANGGLATNLKLTANPLGVAADNAGNFYIADGGAARVWKVNSAGIVSTAAGGGPSNADGIQATGAQITVSGIALDSAGNLYISGGSLRRVTPAGVITTIAQVNASNVAVDGAGNIYLADILNSRIRKVDPSGVVTTLAGTGVQGNSGDGGPAVNAALFLPQGVSVDSAGNVYFADNAAYVRKVDTAGIITRFAGNGSPLGLGDGGPALNSGMTPVFTAVDSAGNVLIVDSGAGRIRKVNAAGIISTVAGGGLPLSTTFGDGGPATSAYLSGPRSVAVDNAGNLYIGDDNNRKIRKVSSGAPAGSPIQATPSTLSFSVNAGAPAPPAQTVVIISPGATLTFTAAASTTAGGSWLSVTPASGNVNLVLTISVNPSGLAAGSYTGTVTLTPSGAGNSPLTIPVKLTVNAPTSQGIISTLAGNGFVPYSGEGGPATKAALGAGAVAVDGSGNTYVADSISNRILKINAAGVITSLAGNGAITYAGDGGPASRASFFSPLGVAADQAGNVYIADTSNNRVRKVDTAGNISTVAGTGNVGFSGDGGPATSAPLWTPLAVAVDGAGNLFIADGANNRVRKVTAAGVITTVAGGAILPGFSGDGGPATSAGLFLPGGVAVDGAGNLYIADVANNRIRKVNASGIITTVAGNGTKAFSGDGGPATAAAINLFGAHAGIACDSAGNLYIADIANHRIRKVDTSGVITTVAGNGIAGFSGDAGPAVNAGLNNPDDVALDSAGNIYIADAKNNRIRKVTPAPGSAPPGISSNGIVHGATFQPGIVANSWATVLGTNLGAVTDTWANSIVNGKLPTTLDGVSVTVGGKPAYIFYLSPGQINFLVPDVAPGSTPVTVTTPAGVSSTFTVTVAQYGPAFFAWPNNQPVATRQDFTFAVRDASFPGVTTVPAKPGDVIILWGTGFGPTLPSAPVGSQVPGDRTYSTSTPPTVTINNIQATVFGAALAPGFAGLYQVAVQVPASLTDGDFPIVASIGGVSSPAGIVLSVRR